MVSVHKKKIAGLVLSLLAAVGLSSTANAQEWPVKTVTFLNPFPAGGGTDAFARPLAAQLTEQLGKQFIIDNRGGAGGTVGASVAAKAAPDGYTWFIGAIASYDRSLHVQELGLRHSKEFHSCRSSS
ncbi:MAG: hypothetical protein RLZZ365_256 [Pseudomonadota bacterium]|jgi:tripartite-type tricarboxylate transporter receptor subunit TctC